MKRAILVFIVVVAVVAVGGMVAWNNKNTQSNKDVAIEAGTTASSEQNDHEAMTGENTSSSSGQVSNKSESSTSVNMQSNTTNGQTTSTVALSISNFAFSNTSLTIKKGTTVTWTNQDTVKHNVHSNQANGPKGGLLARGESYSFTFNTAGTYQYICEPHPNMKGTVTVTE